ETTSLFYQVSHSLSTTFSSFFNKCVTGTSLTALLVYDIFTVIVNSFLQNVAVFHTMLMS
ncbi:hypothetical protein, partial [Streptococcus pyogenes]|uniref:hypothetical protein n=1 Tax=Streptococcus pyogenes TaxID=1314 RepID=UPI001B34FC8F